MKQTLYIITLEQIEKRYTKQWYTYWNEEFSKYFDVTNIDGDLISDKIESGRFLDINDTNIWKANQVIRIARLFKDKTIKDGDTFIFADGWHFGITALKYMAQLNKVNIKIYSYLHAGTWDEHDFISQAGLGDWARYNELGWLKASDGIFVATDFHKNLITDYFGIYSKDKIQVVGFPMDWKTEIEIKIDTMPLHKDNLIVFPHRLDKEKQPQVFDDLIKKFPDYKFVKTMEVTDNKKEYYELLSKAKIVFSSSLQETFGIGTVEAMYLGAMPVVPNRLAYQELYLRRFKYNSDDSMYEMIKYFIEHYNDKDLQKARRKNIMRIVDNSKDSIKKMSGMMLNE